jgi:hypothetical protein
MKANKFIVHVIIVIEDSFQIQYYIKTVSFINKLFKKLSQGLSTSGDWNTPRRSNFRANSSPEHKRIESVKLGRRSNSIIRSPPPPPRWTAPPPPE